MVTFELIDQRELLKNFGIQESKVLKDIQLINIFKLQWVSVSILTSQTVLSLFSTKWALSAIDTRTSDRYILYLSACVNLCLLHGYTKKMHLLVSAPPNVTDLNVTITIMLLQ